LLESRTPHQPEKLGNVSKNECVFTPSIFTVKQKHAHLSAAESIECSPFTSRCHDLVQSGCEHFDFEQVLCGFPKICRI